MKGTHFKTMRGARNPKKGILSKSCEPQSTFMNRKNPKWLSKEGLGDGENVKHKTEESATEKKRKRTARRTRQEREAEVKIMILQ